MEKAFNLLIEAISDIALKLGVDREHISTFRHETVLEDIDLETFLDEFLIIEQNPSIIEDLPGVLEAKLGTAAVDQTDLDTLHLVYILDDIQDAMEQA